MAEGAQRAFKYHVRRLGRRDSRASSRQLRAQSSSPPDPDSMDVASHLRFARDVAAHADPVAHHDALAAAAVDGTAFHAHVAGVPLDANARADAAVDVEAVSTV